MLNLRKLYSTGLVIASLLFVSSNAMAQTNNTQKGSFMIGGEIGLSTSSSTVKIDGGTTEGSDATQFNIAPSVGYFFANNFALGIGVDFTLNTVTNKDRNEFDSDLLFGPFVRYYVPFGQKALFFEVDFGYGNSADEITINNQKQNAITNVFAVGVGPGFTIFSNDHIGIEALAKYNFANSNTTLTSGGTTTKSTSITHAFDFSVGLQVYFTRN